MSFRYCVTGCGLEAAPGDVFCDGCGSARESISWTDLPPSAFGRDLGPAQLALASEPDPAGTEPLF